MMRDRTADGKRGNVTEIWAAWSSVALLRESAPLGSSTAFQVHWRIGYSLQSTLTSLMIVELSPLLTRCRTRFGLALTISKSNFGLPQFWVFQPTGAPLEPTGALDQSSTETRAPCADTTEAAASRSTPRIGPFRIVSRTSPVSLVKSPAPP